MAVSTVLPLLGTPQNFDDVEQSFAALQTWLGQQPRLTFLDLPRVFVKINTNLTLTNDTETQVTWSAPALNDNDADFSGTPDSGWNVGGIWRSDVPKKFQAPSDGLYLVQYSVRFDGNGTGSRYAFITTYGHTNAPADLLNSRAAAATNGQTVGNGMVLPMKKGEELALSAYQNSRGDLALIAGFLNTWMQVTKLA